MEPRSGQLSLSKTFLALALHSALQPLHIELNCNHRGFTVDCLLFDVHINYLKYLTSYATDLRRHSTIEGLLFA